MHLAIKKHITATLALGIVALLISLFSGFPKAVLNYYVTGIYPHIGATLRSITTLFPFPVGDIGYLFLIILACRSLFLGFKKLKNKLLSRQDLIRIPVVLLNTGLLCYIIFKLIWGLNYARPPINAELSIPNQMYSVKELTKLGGFFILKLNDIKPNRSVYYSVFRLEKEAAKSYQLLEKENALFKYRHPEVKPALNSWLISSIGLEGYYNPFSGEANVNMRLPQFRLPFTVCHEIAHQVGVAREDEANLMAYLTATNSNDVNFRYSAYYSILTNILYELRYKSPENFEKLYALLPTQVLADIKTDRQFWAKYNNKLFQVMSSAIDGYLKLNNQEAGIDSYQNIVLWVYNFHKEELESLEHPLRQ